MEDVRNLVGQCGRSGQCGNVGKLGIVGIKTFWAEHAKRPKNANWTKQAL